MVNTDSKQIYTRFIKHYISTWGIFNIIVIHRKCVWKQTDNASDSSKPLQLPVYEMRLCSLHCLLCLLEWMMYIKLLQKAPQTMTVK